MQGIRLIVGLGNPGERYSRTRHNVGFRFVDLLCREYRVHLSEERRFQGRCGRFDHRGNTVRLLCPTTYMNASGRSVQLFSHYHRVDAEQMLVVHDDLDLPVGAVRLKSGGGHGGHNGLRDIMGQLGNGNFARLRIGIGHPGQKERVVSHVLKAAGEAEQEAIESVLRLALDELPRILDGELSAAMNRLNGSGKMKAGGC